MQLTFEPCCGGEVRVCLYRLFRAEHANTPLTFRKNNFSAHLEHKVVSLVTIGVSE